LFKRIILVGPSHRVDFAGLAASDADAWATPLGHVKLDRDAVNSALSLRQVQVLDQAHRIEHSLEVQLPFLQRTLDQFRIVPLLVGGAGTEEVCQVIEKLWDGPETAVVVSSDLSHYCDYHTARKMDQAASRAIEALRDEDLSDDQACGVGPIRGLLRAARARGLRVRTVDLRNSGDTAGPRHEVVGYGAYVFCARSD
jgi:AmmeMemoRadiSam system protein B